MDDATGNDRQDGLELVTDHDEVGDLIRRDRAERLQTKHAGRDRRRHSDDFEQRKSEPTRFRTPSPSDVTLPASPPDGVRRAAAVDVDALAPQRERTVAESCRRDRIADERDSRRSLVRDDEADRRGIDMEEVGDDVDGDTLLEESPPNGAGSTRSERRHRIHEVRHVSRAGRHCRVEALRRRPACDRY